jgi:DNA-binding Lrp family transcriptional regulator
MDQIDRILLSALSEDASRGYAELADLVQLSAPAVHQRVRRLKQDGVITATVAMLDGVKVGRPLLAFVRIKAHKLETVARLAELMHLPAIEEIHELTGEAGAIMKVRARDAGELKSLLEQVQTIEGCEGTLTDIVLSTLVERGVSVTR